MKKKALLKRSMAFLLTAVMAGSFLSAIPSGLTNVQASDEITTTKTIAGLGTGVIANPTVPTSVDDPWAGSYVYFGAYDDSPVKYRVLDKESTDFGGTTMLLDCDTILWAGSDPSSVFDSDSNVWRYSDIEKYLNSGFSYSTTGFLTTSFSIPEQNAIAYSKKLSAIEGKDGNGWSYLAWTNLNDKIFFLDAMEVTNASYGYYNIKDEAVGRIKTGGEGDWWLRSAFTDVSYVVGCVNESGQINCGNAKQGHVGVSPALNINLSSILFTSLISGTVGVTGAEYKLTIIDSEMTIEKNGVATRNGNTVTIPYNITGVNAANVTQTSILILDRAYSDDTKDEAVVKYYGALDTSAGAGKGTFTLPDELSAQQCGSDYYAYIIAEDVNGEKETDYASAPVEITSIEELVEITRVEVNIDTPKGNAPFDTTVECDTVGVESVSLKWTNTDGNEQSGNANFYPWTYIANFTFTAEYGYAFSSTTEVIINNGGISIEDDGVTLNSDGTLSVKSYDIFSSKDKLISITAPQSITVANGTVYEDMNLPETVTIVTEGNTVTTADVAWNTTTPASGSYNPTVLTEQTVTLNGTVTCPEDVDVNGVELKTTISITISAAGIVGAPTVNPVAGTYTENRTVVLTSTTEGATIYYTTDGTTPSKTNGTKYTTPITVSGVAGQSVTTTIKAIAIKDGMQDSKVETFVYTINIPKPQYTITATAGDNGSITPSGAVKVTEGESKVYTITANEGYEIDTLKVDGVKVTVATSYTFDNVAVDHMIEVTFKEKTLPEKPGDSEGKEEPTNPTPDSYDYEIIEGEDGEWTLDSDGNLTVKGNGDFSKFVGVKVDGKLIDAKNYIAKEDSTIITLNADYLNTLSEGKHTFEIVWNDGSAATSFVIKEDGNVIAPNTGDTVNLFWFILLLISGAGILLTGKRKYDLKKED